jgi:tetratricopeptide (TPR) repeat protein
LANRQSNPYWQSFALKNLCYSSRRRNRYEEAIEFGLQALGAAEKMGYRRVAAQAHGNLVPAFRYLGDFESALLHGKQAIAFFRSIRAQGDIINCLSELGLVYDVINEPRKAIEYHRQAYEIAHELNLPDAARHAENLATALINTGQWDAATYWNQRASELAAKREIPFLKRNRARIEYGRGNLQEAVRICGEVLQSDTTDAVIRWSVYDLLGEIEAKQNRFQEATVGDRWRELQDHATFTVDPIFSRARGFSRITGRQRRGPARRRIQPRPRSGRKSGTRIQAAAVSRSTRPSELR